MFIHERGSGGGGGGGVGVGGGEQEEDRQFCRDFSRGCCPRGVDVCPFKHVVNGRDVCRNFNRGHCERVPCPFAHWLVTPQQEDDDEGGYGKAKKARSTQRTSPLISVHELKELRKEIAHLRDDNRTLREENRWLRHKLDSKEF